jgi:hypothetical protein
MYVACSPLKRCILCAVAERDRTGQNVIRREDQSATPPGPDSELLPTQNRKAG